jgi:hypothetical protein
MKPLPPVLLLPHLLNKKKGRKAPFFCLSIILC